MGAVLWAEASDDGPTEDEEIEVHGEVDETFASRRLRRWLKGMFGGPRKPDEQNEHEPET
jgi:hypothetical protein